MSEWEPIKSISYSQDEILTWIHRLYIPEGRLDADVTYSKGVFYGSGAVPQPLRKFDLHPQADDVVKADCRALPLADHSIRSLMADPPFLAATGPSLAADEGNIMGRRFSVCASEKALAELYRKTIAEAWRVLCPGGVLVFKCQDKVSSGKQYMMHCSVYAWAVAQGFVPLDIFILLAKSRLIAKWQRQQKHARKYHCYFWVFRKK